MVEQAQVDAPHGLLIDGNKGGVRQTGNSNDRSLHDFGTFIDLKTA